MNAPTAAPTQQAPDHLAVDRTVSIWHQFQASRYYDPATRVVHSFWQVAAVRIDPLVTVVIAAGAVTHAVWVGLVAALLAGAGAGVASLLLSLATWPVPALPRAADTAVRLVRTAVAAVAGSFAAALVVNDQALVHFGWGTAVFTAAGSAVLALVKTQLVNSAANVGGAWSPNLSAVTAPAPLRLGGTAGVPES